MRSMRKPCEPLIKTASDDVRFLLNHSIIGSGDSNSKMFVDFIPARFAASAMIFARLPSVSRILALLQVGFVSSLVRQ